MRVSFRIKVLRVLTIFFMLSETQTLEGVTSKVVTEPKEKHLHFIFFDLDSEKGSFTEILEKFREIQREFNLGDIFFFSDSEGSYRAWCWSKRPWITYLHILLHSFPFLDYGFWVWTVRRGAATLRTSNKKNRPRQKCVAVLHGYEETMIPERLEYVQYDTGVEKRGKVIELGRVS